MMKVGDLVRYNHPAWTGTGRIGVIVGMRQSWSGYKRLNQLFRILWRDGTIGDDIWDYDLKVLNEDR